jgi:hypothetical protein
MLIREPVNLNEKQQTLRLTLISCKLALNTEVGVGIGHLLMYHPRVDFVKKQTFIMIFYLILT